MDTVYYTLGSEKVKVSGGVLPMEGAQIPVKAPVREVLDFDRCRRKLETGAAWEELNRVALEIPQAPEEVPAPAVRRQRRTRRERMGNAANWAELCAAATVILVSLGSCITFLHML